MRDKHYKSKSYRLSDEVIKKFGDLKKERNTSFNLLLKELIKNNK